MMTNNATTTSTVNSATNMLGMPLPVDVSRTLVADVLEFVEAKMGSNDGSHDVEHVLRVTRTALRIALAEKTAGRAPNVDLATVVVVALLHDVTDTKYTADPTEANRGITTILVDKHGYTPAQVARILQLIERISFRKEQAVRAAAAAAGLPPPTIPVEVQAVQDADRLDAIGAIGIARCFTFGGTRHRALYQSAVSTNHDDLVQRTAVEGSEVGSEASLYHFYEKLFKLKGLMKTETGRVMAERRHQVMADFVAEFWREVHLDGDDLPLTE
ncbi:hypothetical protein GGF31_007804 [Allomyces arbusculus]|nr:hypothetical protein GGF31_007804 [Allomyces arbusculus]